MTEHADSYRKAAEDLIAAWYRDPESVIEAARDIGVSALDAAEAFQSLCLSISDDEDPE